MAITKLKTLANGVSGDHWVIPGVIVSADGQSARLTAQLFKDKASWVSGVAPIHQQDVILQGSDNPLTSVVLIELCENKLVSLAGDFLGGTVVQP
jgi:hypothetical protein